MGMSDASKILKIAEDISENLRMSYACTMLGRTVDAS
jgi:hypothetical protein